jgi:uncharacterized protein (DUF362 family)/Pyruvate/2-oxoacid:ferredoxin oxidoreductase delta subunit
MNSKVSLARCESYQPAEVEAAVRKSLEPLGGITRFVKPGQKVLIKPNALLARPPESAVTTHPAVISAVIKGVIKAGGTALVGDSPGNAYIEPEHIMEISGIRKAVEDAGGRMAYFQQAGAIEVKNPRAGSRMPLLYIARPVLEADVIINLPKLKTHQLTSFTGAIKNMFGIVPGFNKTRFHAAAPHPRDLAELLVDVYESARPQLTIMDGVTGMEGNGPSNGRPRQLGLIIVSEDGVALDAVSSYLIGFRPAEIDTTVAAFRRKLGEMDLGKIEILGPSLKSLRQADWAHPFNAYSLVKKFIPRALFNLATPFINLFKVRPVIDQAKCTQCLVCVKNCPTHTINHDPQNNRVEIDPQGCISCFCCHELCEYGAVRVERSLPVKLLKIGLP